MKMEVVTINEGILVKTILHVNGEQTYDTSIAIPDRIVKFTNAEPRRRVQELGCFSN